MSCTGDDCCVGDCAVCKGRSPSTYAECFGRNIAERDV
jgi:hypothetical protein